MYQVEMQLYRDHLIERFKRRNSVKMSPPPRVTFNFEPCMHQWKVLWDT